MDARTFKYEALMAVRRHALTHRLFTALDVALAHPFIKTDEPRSWGHIMKTAVGKGMISHNAYITQTYPEGSGTNASITTQWRSLICAGGA